MARADRILLVLDDTAPGEAPMEVMQYLPPHLPRTLVRNKIDLTGRRAGISHTEKGAEILLSAKTGAGLDVLRQHLKDCMGFQPVGEGTFIARRRHLDAIRRAQGHIAHGRAQLKESRAGEFTPEALLGRNFSSFCLGKVGFNFLHDSSRRSWNRQTIFTTSFCLRHSSSVCSRA